MDEEQQVGYLVSIEDRARVETRSMASDALIQFQHGRIAVLQVEVSRRDARLAERDALVEELQQAVVTLTRQVLDIGGEPASGASAQAAVEPGP